MATKEIETVHCSNCEEAAAAVRCEQCQEVYCRPCGEVLHKSAARKLHLIVEVVKPTGDTNLGEDDAGLEEQCGNYSESEDEGTTAGVTRSVLLWSGSDVASWVAGLPSPCNDYGAVFRDQHVRGRVLALLTPAALDRMGVAPEHQPALLEQTARLQIKSHIAALQLLRDHPPARRTVVAK